MREWYVLTYILGAFFVAGQISSTPTSCPRASRLSSDAYGSVFYLTTGFHGLHVTGGLIAFLFIIGRTFTTSRFTHARRPRDRRPRTTGTSSTSSGSRLFATIYLLQ